MESILKHKDTNEFIIVKESLSDFYFQEGWRMHYSDKRITVEIRKSGANEEIIALIPNEEIVISQIEFENDSIPHFMRQRVFPEGESTFMQSGERANPQKQYKEFQRDYKRN